MGRDYPKGYTYFRDKTHNAFLKNKDVTDPDKISELIRFGEYIMNELKALYSLKKYRTMKNRYYKDPPLEELSPSSTSTQPTDPKSPGSST